MSHLMYPAPRAQPVQGPWHCISVILATYIFNPSTNVQCREDHVTHQGRRPGGGPSALSCSKSVCILSS